MSHHSYITSQNTIFSRDQRYWNISIKYWVSARSQLWVCIVWVMVFPKQGFHENVTGADGQRVTGMHVPIHGGQSHRASASGDCLHAAHGLLGVNCSIRDSRVLRFGFALQNGFCDSNYKQL